MSKDLPYFKFVCDEYLTGDVVLQPYDIQGIFINVCAIYWKRDCDISVHNLHRRFNRVLTIHQWKRFMASGLIKVEGEMAVIEFLDEQWKERNTEHLAKSRAGKLGAESRWQKDGTAKEVPLAKHGNKDKDKDIDKDKEGKSPGDKSPDTKNLDYLDKIINEFVEAYGDYVVVNRGMERAAAGKLAGIYRQKYPKASTEDALVGLRTYFNACVLIQDQWLHNNMSLTTISSRFNQVNAILKNERTTGNRGATPKELANLIAKKHGTDSGE